MQKKENGKITAFDTLFTTDHIRKCKILLPYLDTKMQRVFALYIKLSELSYTLSFFENYPDTDIKNMKDISIAEFESENSNMPNNNDFGQNIYEISEICEELMPYSTDDEKEKLSNFSNMFNQLKNMQDMMEMIQVMKELFPENGTDMSSLLSGLSMGDTNNGDSLDLSSLMQIMQMLQSRE